MDTPFMSGLAVADRPEHGDLVSNVGGFSERFAERLAGNLGRNGLEITAIFDRSVRLGIESLLLRDAARQKDVNDAFRLGFEMLVLFLFGLGLAHAEKIA